MFQLFLESILFFKNCQILQKQCCPVLVTQSRVDPVACPSHEPTQRIFATHWRVNVPIVKNTQNIFQNLGFYVSYGANWRLVHGWRSSRGGTQRFSQLTLRLSRKQNFQSRKTLRKFFKIFVLSVLATCSRLNSVAKIACFAQIGQFLKPFSFSLEHF